MIGKKVKNKKLTINDILILAVRHQQKGNFKEAKKNYQEILKIDHDHVAATNNLGVVLIELKDYQEAKICLEKVIQINPKHEKAYNNLGSVLRELGDYQKAKECY